MDEQEQVIEETSQTSQTAESNTENQETEQETIVSHEESSEEENAEVVAKSEYDKVKQLADNYKIRAEKAEKKAKTSEKPVVQSQQQSGTLSPTDLYALLQAAVPQEDVAEVTDYAKLKGITVTEALKSSVVKNVLAEKAENRKVADATNITTTRRNTGKISDEMLLNTARSKGEVPDGDAEIQRLYQARQDAKRGK
jgi:hypothetical protein